LKYGEQFPNHSEGQNPKRPWDRFARRKKDQNRERGYAVVGEAAGV